ncbi:hypothetical protein [Hydrogenimonas sp.]
MKNYRALTKLRKQQFERAEQELMRANALLDGLLAERERLRADERGITLPSEGEGGRISALLAQRRAIQAALDLLQVRIESAQRAKEEKERLLKAAHIAYEQAKSIESQVLESILLKEKRRVQNFLDEAASRQFWRLMNRKEEYR